MTRKRIIPSIPPGILTASSDQKKSTNSFIKLVSSPDLPKDMARRWISQLSVEELEIEKAWLDKLFQDKKDGIL